jgi:hypothetical protein
MLRAQRHRPQARAADLVQRPGAASFGEAGLDMRLTRRVLALTGGQHLAQDRLLDLGLVDAGAGDDRLDHRGAQIMRRGIGERAVEAAHGGTARPIRLRHWSFLSLCALAARLWHEGLAPIASSRKVNLLQVQEPRRIAGLFRRSGPADNGI